MKIDEIKTELDRVQAEINRLSLIQKTALKEIRLLVRKRAALQAELSRNGGANVQSN